MKTLIKTLFISFALIIVFNSNTSAQKKNKKAFSGIITYEIKYEGADIEPAQLAQLPTESVLIIKGNKSKEESMMGGAYFTQILDGDEQSIIVLIEGGGQKIFFNLTKEELEALEDDDDEPKIKLLEETKVVAGYTCKKAEVTTKDEYDEDVTVAVYYCEELGSKALNFSDDFKDINGLPMEYQVKSENWTEVHTVKSVEKKKIKDVSFMVPADAEELTAEQKQQFMKMIKGGDNQ